MPNLPKPRLRRGRADGKLVSAAQPERRSPRRRADRGRGSPLVQHRASRRPRARLAGRAFRLPRPRPRGRRSRATSGRRSTSTTTTSSSSSTSRCSTARPAGWAPASSTSSSVPTSSITIPNQPLPPVEYLFERCESDEKLREKLFRRGSGYLLYRIVDDSFDYCFPMLRKIGNKLDALEDDIFEGHSEEVVRDISNTKQEIINFRKVIRPQRAGASRPREGQVAVPRRATSTSRSTSTTSSTPTSGSGTCSRTTRKSSRRSRRRTSRVLSHRVNDVLRVLTAISVIVLPLTLIASDLRHERALPGRPRRIVRRALLGDRRRDAGDPRRDGRVLPQAPLAIACVSND